MYFEECLANFIAGRGEDPRLNWYQGQIGFIQGYILPLTERCERLLSGESCSFVEETEKVLKEWKEKGQAWSQKIIADSQSLDITRQANGLCAMNGRENSGLKSKEQGKNEQSTGVCPFHASMEAESSLQTRKSPPQNGINSHDEILHTNRSSTNDRLEEQEELIIRRQEELMIRRGVCPVRASEEIKKSGKKKRRRRHNVLRWFMLRRSRRSLRRIGN